MTNTDFRTSPSEVNQQQFHLLTIDDLYALPPEEWLVKDVLPCKGIGSIYGASGSGKTFFMLDLLLAIASKPEWCGFKLKNVPVTYVCLESLGGISKRIQAWEIATGSTRPLNFKIIADNFNLTRESDVRELANVINGSGMGSGVIAVDTLNAASPKTDENASKEMGLVIEHLKLLQRLTNGLVLFIHHTGKDAAKELRGHSSLKASIDVAIVINTGTKRSWHITKLRDGEGGIGFGFKLVQQTVGTDQEGKPITSCAVEMDCILTTKHKLPTGKYQIAVLDLISRKCSEDLDNGGAIRLQDAIRESARVLDNTSENKRSNRANEIIEGLVAGGHLASIETDGTFWLCR
jgi:hypothetical protein